MNRDDVIGMVREVADKTAVDPVHGDPPLIVVSPDEMIRFAKLAQVAEREACAKLLDEIPAIHESGQNHVGGCLICGLSPQMIAAAIRARSKT